MERRKHKIFKAQERVYVILKDNYYKLGQQFNKPGKITMR
jgi:hypothetical protein